MSCSIFPHACGNVDVGGSIFIRFSVLGLATVRSSASKCIPIEPCSDHTFSLAPTRLLR